MTISIVSLTCLAGSALFSLWKDWDAHKHPGRQYAVLVLILVSLGAGITNAVLSEGRTQKLVRDIAKQPDLMFLGRASEVSQTLQKFAFDWLQNMKAMDTLSEEDRKTALAAINESRRFTYESQFATAVQDIAQQLRIRMVINDGIRTCTSKETMNVYNADICAGGIALGVRSLRRKLDSE